MHPFATENPIALTCAGASPDLCIMRDHLATMQARRDPWYFPSQHRVIRHLMHFMQTVDQWKSTRATIAHDECR